ncbi:MAG: 4-hydroxy-tetrahydrodipicolinate synthase [Cytophagaceae bacterium]|nr:4-hydroxy-tetrahydrodipicolinate synthase [Cytophagaceae bacterium]
MNSRFIGTGVALVTPFKADHSIDFEGLKNLVAHVSKGADYLVVHGTTGESATTTLKEKQEILDFIIKENHKKLPVMVGIGGNNTTELISRMNSCNLKGVEAILSVCPYYNKPSQEGIYQHYKAIAENSPLPIMLYNVPGRTGVNMKPKTVKRLAEIENIFGIKEASGDIVQALEISKINRKDFLLISGDDMLTVPMIAIGGKGIISVIGNAFPVEFGEMVNAALKNDFVKAAEIQRSFTEINPLLYEESNPVGIKQTLEILGICKGNVRLPLAKASEQLGSKIEKVISSVAIK